MYNKPTKPFFRIITRTYNRPKGFANLVSSLNYQTYKNFVLDVIEDADSDRYAKKILYNNPLFIQWVHNFAYKGDKSKYSLKEKYLNGNASYGQFIQNLFFNDNLDYSEEWVIFIDDDDQLASKNSLQIIADLIQSDKEVDIVFFQMKTKSGVILPPDKFFNQNKPKLSVGQIGGSCFAYDSSKIKEVKWDGYKCADFRFIEQIRSKSKKEIWHKEPLIQLNNNGGIGKGIDI